MQREIDIQKGYKYDRKYFACIWIVLTPGKHLKGKNSINKRSYGDKI
jgi:hypothetical protein